MDRFNESENEKREELSGKILSAIGGIRYGSVEIIIHDSKVVQIERKEKIRLEPGPTAPLK